MRTRSLIYLLLAIAIAVSAFAVMQYFNAPRILRVAVPMQGSDNHQLMNVIAQVLYREQASIRLRVKSVEGGLAAAAALDAGDADLAVLRTDIAIPRQGETVAILREDPVILVAMPGLGIKTVGDLVGKRIAMAAGEAANRRMLDQLLGFYDISPEALTVVFVPQADFAAAIQENRADAYFLVSQPSKRLARDIVTALSNTGKGEPTFIEVPEALAINLRNPAIASSEIVQGAFGGSPARPSEEISTIAVSHRLFARRQLSEATVAELTRLTFTHKAAITAEVALAARITQPTAIRTDVLPVHPGASAYYDGEIKSIFDRFGDWFYLAAILLGFGGSLIATLVSRAHSRQRKETLTMLDDLVALLNSARSADTNTSLDDLEQQADAIFGATMLKAREENLDTGTISAFSFAFDHVHRAIADRRKLVDFAAPRVNLALRASA